MFDRKNCLNDIKFSLVYLFFAVFILIAIINLSFQMNVDTIFGRYQYTGSETMSLFGLLDLAHYRNYAPFEIMGWQFFFGNFQYFIIFSLVMAGFFHLIHPKSYKTDEEIKEIKPNEKQMKIFKIAIVSTIGIIALEILFSLIGDPETGLGSHLFTNSFYQSIPELITNGFYVVNNVSYFSQIFISIIPVLCGFGLFFYIHGLKNYKNRGLIDSKFKINVLGVIILTIGLLYYIIMLISSEINVSTAMSGYTEWMMIFWFICSLGTTAFILLIIRSMIHKESDNKGNYKFNIKAILKFLLIFAMILITIILFTLPNMGKSSLADSDIVYSGSNILPWISGIIMVGLLILFTRKERGKNYIKARAWTLFFGFVSVMGLLIYIIFNSHNIGAIEIAWFYNSIIPFVFIICLTMVFYFLGFIIQAKVVIFIQMRESRNIESRNSATDNTEIAGKRLLPTYATKVKIYAIILLVINIIAVPCAIGMKMFEEDPIIAINNVGLLPNQEKTFFLSTKYDYADNLGTFEVIDIDTGNAVYQGDLIKQGYLWQRYYWKGNFTALTTIGNYYIRTSLGNEVKAKSNEFKIDPNYLDDAMNLCLYWFYYARSGTKVESVHEGYEGHEAGHLHDAWYLYHDKTNNRYVYVNSSHTNMGLDNNTMEWVITDQQNLGMNLTGAWMDSGDYNVYSERVVPCSLSLVYSYDLLPNFFHEEKQIAGYPQNDSIPDVLEESYFGLQWWAKRWYDEEKLYFRGNELGRDGSIRWTVFCPVEYEEDFGYGRWVTGEHNQPDQYQNQFLRNSGGLAIAACFAAMARQCEEGGYYLENITQFKEFANKSRLSYGKYLSYNYYSLACEKEMYKLTGNTTYLQNAINIANYLINRSSSLSTFPGFTDLGYTLDFSKEFNGTDDWDGLGYIVGNNTVSNLVTVINSRTLDETNYFNFLRKSVGGEPVIWNPDYLDGILACSFAWNITNNASAKTQLMNYMTRHLDWFFGRNMENLCLIEGISGGENNAFDYFTRYKYAPGNLRGIFPGFIVDGFQYFPGDVGEKNDANRYLIPKISNAYREVWSHNSQSFQKALSAFLSQVLQKS